MSDLFQSVPFAVVLLIIGFVFLVKGAEHLLRGVAVSQDGIMFRH